MVGRKGSRIKGEDLGVEDEGEAFEGSETGDDTRRTITATNGGFGSSESLHSVSSPQDAGRSQAVGFIPSAADTGLDAAVLLAISGLDDVGLADSQVVCAISGRFDSEVFGHVSGSDAQVVPFVSLGGVGLQDGSL